LQRKKLRVFKGFSLSPWYTGEAHMVISMARPWRHPETGAWYFRGRVPADLLDKLGGQKLTVRVGGADRTILLRGIIKISLGTKEAGEAKVRHAAVQAQLQDRWALARKAPVALSHEEIMGLAGRAYRELIAEFRSNPGEPEGWEVYQDQLLEPFEHLDDESDGVADPPYNPKLAMKQLTKLVDLDEVVGISGVALDDRSRLKLLKEVAWARVQAAKTLERFALGDYGPDTTAERFPQWQPQGGRPAVAGRGAGRLEDLISGWAKEKNPRPATLDLWRTYIAEFVSFIGHDDPSAIRRQDVVAWKQKLLDDGVSPKTINDSKLAALKAILGWAADNELLRENPAARVAVKRAKKPGERMLGFTKEEAATILLAASQQTSPVYRWVPLLCAASGARVAEVCQLRAEDIEQVDQHWVMHIRADAGSVKNVNSERTVPLHPSVIQAGFPEFAKRKGEGALFFDPQRRKVGAKKPQAKIVAKNVAAWVHRLGVEVGRKEHRKDPNHGWRHLFKTLGREAGVQDSVLDAITGNAPPTVGQSYGEAWLTTTARAVALIQLPGAGGGAQQAAA
jgi:integrase